MGLNILIQLHRHIRPTAPRCNEVINGEHNIKHSAVTAVLQLTIYMQYSINQSINQFICGEVKSMGLRSRYYLYYQ